MPRRTGPSDTAGAERVDGGKGGLTGVTRPTTGHSPAGAERRGHNRRWILNSKIIQFLNREQIRATYTAVAGILGVQPISMGARLGPHSVEKSWIVSKKTGKQTDYTADEIHPALSNSDVIQTTRELRRRMNPAAQRPN